MNKCPKAYEDYSGKLRCSSSVPTDQQDLCNPREKKCPWYCEQLEAAVEDARKHFSKTDLDMKAKMEETLLPTFWLRHTPEYSRTCDQCRDEILIYPTLSGRTEYSQEEVESIARRRILNE